MIEAIFGLIGVIVGIIGTYYFSLKSLRYQAVDEARSNFRAALLPVIMALDDESIYLPNVINKEIANQEVAFWNLLSQLSRHDRAKLNKAWLAYSKPNENDFPETPRIEYDGEERKKVVKILRERINKMMRYAEIAY